MNAVDALAISMLAVVLTGFGVVATIFISMARNAGNRDLQLEELMQEATRPAPPPGGNKAPTPEPPREAWEREVDWWRQG